MEFTFNPMDIDPFKIQQDERRFHAACTAMQGLMQSMHVGFKMDPRSYTELAEEAVAHADALLQALAEGEKP